MTPLFIKNFPLLLSLRLAFHLDLHFPSKVSEPFSIVLRQRYLREISVHETEMIGMKIFTPAVTPLPAHAGSRNLAVSSMQQQALSVYEQKVSPQTIPSSCFRTGLTEYLL